MCWSAPVSFSSWLLVLFAAALGYVNGAVTGFFALFLATYGCIQLVEGLAWSYLGDPRRNSLISALGLAVILLEPVASSLTLLDSPSARGYLPLFLTIYALVALAMLAAAAVRPQWRLAMSVAPNGHLRWHWLDLPPALLAAWSVCLIAPLFAGGMYITGAFAVATLAASIVGYARDGTWSSMWCWFGAVASLAVIAKVLWSMGSCGR